MMFLQSHGISTLFAVRIYKEYGDNAIALVTKDPYRLANDFYGIGFFSADQVALSIGLAPDSPERVMAGISHVLAASREVGHCYLTGVPDQIPGPGLLESEPGGPAARSARSHGARGVADGAGSGHAKRITEPCYYSKSLFYDELYVAKKIRGIGERVPMDRERVEGWIDRYCEDRHIR